MKRLILMRHAKSSWSDPGQADIERPLNKRGRRNAPTIGKWLAREGYLPQLALVSSALRTRETWDGVSGEVPACPAEFQSTLYHASSTTMLSSLRGASTADCVLMLGHQPGIGDFARRLLAETPRNSEFDRYPTSAVSVIDFECSEWREIGWGTGRLTAFIVPKLLEDAPD